MTQPTLNRRGFLAALAALPLAGKALDLLAAMKPAQPLWACSRTTVAGGRFTHITLQKAYRKIQQQALEGFQWQAEEWDAYVNVAAAPSGFRAWSQRHPS